MLWLSLLALVLLVGVVAAILGRWEGAAVPQPDGAAGATSDVDELLRRRAQTEITPADLEELRLDSAVRGYRMDQVDRLLDALEAQLREAERQRDRADHRSRERPSGTSDKGESRSHEGEPDSGFHRAE
ncbi:DivIVA domain-containing protein [Nesterenkonia sp. Act20]|uniref:DivIVA domain-containing protein n=1 Tax=Nesterenkonia sp. Act20 TaxID=1483432 RepID=UPI001C4773E2|nr:DivIVA domain-containing protein [Nesterenkonia sp. Act20]